MQQKHLHIAAKLIAGAGIGFSFFWLTSHPKSSFRGKIPAKRVKSLSLLPNIQYAKKDTIYHLHHWLLLSICYVPLLRSKKLRSSHVFHGLFLGSIIQGLLYGDRFKFSYPIHNKRQEYI